ncbi:hypothetical protein Hanom_Chr13g01213211 [Helianthus anomalus]
MPLTKQIPQKKTKIFKSNPTYQKTNIKPLKKIIVKIKKILYLLAPYGLEESRKLFLHLLEHPLVAQHMLSITPYTTDLP